MVTLILLIGICCILIGWPGATITKDIYEEVSFFFFILYFIGGALCVVSVFVSSARMIFIETNGNFHNWINFVLNTFI